MRDIVFRGKRLDNGAWVSGALLRNKDKETAIIVKMFIQDEDCSGGSYGGSEVIPETIGQYIGVADKDGRRIFEGDIVKATYTGEGKGLEGAGEVVFENGKFGVLWGHRKELVAFDGFHNHAFEVIGNIHDNKQR